MQAEKLQQKAEEYIKSKGFTYQYYWSDKSGTIYEEHSHKGETVLYTLSGKLVFTYTDTGEEKILQKGDIFFPEKGRNHIAKVFDEGWEVVVGEMIEGDS